MKTTIKKISAMLVVSLCLLTSLTGCGDEKVEYESESSFEYHFYPDEYEEEYSEITKTILLTEDKDYRVTVQSFCDDGAMDIIATYTDDKNEVQKFEMTSPCDEVIDIRANTTNEITFVIIITPDTQGSTIGEILSK